LGSLAFAVWFAYHTTTKTLPELHATHKAERDHMMVRFENNLDKILTAHEATVSKMTKHCEDEIQVVVNAFKGKNA
jgi:hypothetical protein